MFMEKAHQAMGKGKKQIEPLIEIPKSARITTLFCVHCSTKI